MGQQNILDTLLNSAKTVKDLEEIANGILMLGSGGDQWGDEGTTALHILRTYLMKVPGNLKFDVRPKENCHNIAHVHVISPNFDASFSIPEGKLLVGETPKAAIRTIIDSFFENQTTRCILIHKWNDTRPSDCPIGKLDVPEECQE